MEGRLYHVITVKVDPKTGERTHPDFEVLMTATPCTHQEACTILTKLVPRKGYHHQVKEMIS